MDTKQAWVGPYDDTRIFPLIRTYIRECLAPRSNTTPVHMVDTIFDDERLRLVRRVDIKSYCSWAINANLYSQKCRLEKPHELSNKPGAAIRDRRT